ncbi:hypothetical protein FRB99_004930 [Tulasnella sp. 403]|nr:hypothetical protein FRB99_004930 [Tulasnella sp. 403]
MDIRSTTKVYKLTLFVLHSESIFIHLDRSVREENKPKSTPEVGRSRATILRSHNTPIHRLPIELFETIIYQSIPCSQAQAEFIRRIELLLTVSVFFASRIVACPRLWASVHYSHGLTRIARCIKRSGNIPLTIVCQPPRMGSVTRDVMEMVLPHRKRWRSLTLAMNDDPETTGYLSDPAPMLGELVLTSFNWKERFLADEGSFLGCAGPALKKFALKSVLVPWQSLTQGKLGNLETLVLHPPRTSDIKTPYRLTASRLLRILESLPRLKSLELEGELCSETTEPKALKTVTLEGLESLTVRSPAGVFCNILFYIDAPNCTRLQLTSNISPEIVQRITENADHSSDFLRLIGHPLRRTRSLAIQLDKMHLSLTSDESDIELRFKFVTKFFRDDFLASVMKVADMTKMGHLRSLELSGSKPNALRMLKDMAIPRLVDGSVWEWPFPSLRRLNVTYVGDKELKTLVVARCRTPHGASHAAPRLEELRVHKAPMAYILRDVYDALPASKHKSP